VRILAIEPSSCPSLTKGVYAFDYGDTAQVAPIAKMYTLGHDFVPPGIHAGGLRYHGAAPLVSQLVHAGVIEARAAPQLACFEAAVQFARAEGIIPAPESSHAIRGAVDEALRAKEEGKERVILSTCRGTATSTWRSTTNTSRAGSRTSSIRARRWRSRSGSCPRWRCSVLIRHHIAAVLGALATTDGPSRPDPSHVPGHVRGSAIYRPNQTTPALLRNRWCSSFGRLGLAPRWSRNQCERGSGVPS